MNKKTSHFKVVSTLFLMSQSLDSLKSPVSYYNKMENAIMEYHSCIFEFNYSVFQYNAIRDKMHPELTPFASTDFSPLNIDFNKSG
jgi:hypothetical protein